MPDTKITALAAITTVDPAADVLPIVDISDTSMAASGTTKKITSNQILGAGGTATLASATITGALDAARLNVTGSTIPANGVYLGSANNLSFSAASTLGMTLNSTGLGIGVASPATKLDVAGNARVQLAFFTGGSIPGLTNDNPFAYRFPGGGLGLGAATETGTASPIIFYTGQGGVERVRVKGSGQVRFFPLAADPVGAEAGDVYYNSTSNKLKCYNGTTWNDLF